MTLALNLPPELRGYTAELGPALATPVLAAWNPDDSYHEAKQCEAIGAVLIDRLAAHRDIANASIAYIFREKMKTRDRVVLGKMSKADGKLSFFNGYDFVIEINWQAWKHLSDMQKVALIDHELAHCGREENDKGERKWVLVGHDIEEFTGIVNRWGLWRNDLKVFAGAVTHAQQLGMFEGSTD
jgi:hypothetical protein